MELEIVPMKVLELKYFFINLIKKYITLNLISLIYVVLKYFII